MERGASEAILEILRGEVLQRVAQEKLLRSESDMKVFPLDQFNLLRECQKHNEKMCCIACLVESTANSNYLISLKVHTGRIYQCSVVPLTTG